MNPLVAQEFGQSPRGDLAQNIYRAVYVAARQNALGSHAELGSDPQDAHTLALRVVLAQFRNFFPHLLRRSS